MLKYRILTACVLIPLVLAAIFYLPQTYFTPVCAIVTLLAAWEWAQLIGWTKTQWRLLYVAYVLVAIILALFLPPVFIIGVSSIIWFALFIFIAIVRKKAQLIKFPRWLIGIGGVLLLVPFFEAILLLHLKPILLFYLLVVVCMADTAAYFGGRALGKRKLAPVISPNKTMEGTFVALLVIILIAILGQWFLGTPEQSSFGWIKATIPAFIAAVIGDLLESYLKRQVNIKDSGNLLPGHGGILDRLDSVIAAAPVFACGVFSMGLL